MKKEISSRQLGILIFISMLGFKLTFLPASLFKYARTDGIISFFLALIIDLICFVIVFITFLKNEDVSFSAFLEKRIGMFFAKIIYFIFFVFFMFKLFFLISAGFYFVKEAIYEEGILALFLFIFLLTINSLFLFKINSFSRTVEFFFPVIFFVLIFIISLGFLTSNYHSLTPLFVRNSSEIFNGAFRNFISFGDFIFILPFMGKVNFEKIKTNVIKFACFAIIILSSFYIAYFSFFKYTAFMHFHAITDIIEFVPLAAIIENLDWLPTSLMLTIFLLQGTIYFFVVINSLYNITKTKKFSYDKRYILIPFNIVLIVLEFLFFYGANSMLVLSQQFASFICLAISVFISIFCFAISFIKKETERKKHYIVKLYNEDLKWISEMKNFNKNLSKKKIFKVGGQK